MTAAERIAATAAAVDFGRPAARKTGRRPEWPYVPVVITSDETGHDHERQLLGRAYATRTAAVAYAARHIEGMRSHLAERLAEPRCRAIREWYGLPREIEELDQ